LESIQILNSKLKYRQQSDLIRELDELRLQLAEANETIEAVRTGQVDAIVVNNGDGRQLYALKSADLTYRVFIEKMTEGAVTLNKEGIIIYCNSQFAQMIKMPLSQVIGKAFSGITADESRGDYEVCFERSWTGDCKIEALLRSGEDLKPVQLSFNMLQLDEGVSMSIIITDLTAQKNTQRELELFNAKLQAANNALELSNYDLQQFASVASHDLQEPLRKIQIYSNHLRDKAAFASEEDKQFLGKIIDSASRMRKLIIAILNYSKLSADTMDWEYTDLSVLFRELIEDFELVIKEKKAEVTVGAMPSMVVNRGQIRQVFQNILSNALKFSRADLPPRINIYSKRLGVRSFSGLELENGPFCQIGIGDNGIGFDKKYLTSIFSLFERLHSKDRFEGTGIGLAIAKKIVEKHNGLISAVSTEGCGSEFRIILPMVR
jgi:PAS domain S-box-containing protein